MMAEAAEQDGPAGAEGHEQGGVVASGERFEAAAECGAKVETDAGAGVALVLRAWPVEREFEQGRGAGEGLLPVAELFLQAFALEPVALPDGVVAILQCQRGERVVLALLVGFVECDEFLDQEGDGPAVGDDVVHDDAQGVFVMGGFEEQAADQWAAAEIKRGLRFVVELPLLFCCSLRDRDFAEVDAAQAEAGFGFGGDDLLGCAVAAAEGGAQDFVAGDDAVEGALQGAGVECAAEFECAGDVVGAAGSFAFELVEEPEALLGPGEG